MDEWHQRFKRIVESHGLNMAEDAIMEQCRFFIPLPRGEFETYALRCYQDWRLCDFDVHDLAMAVDSLIARKLVRGVSPGEQIPDVNFFGEPEGYDNEYPNGGFVLTPEGWDLFRTIGIEIFGSAYFENERHEPGDAPDTEENQGRVATNGQTG